MFRAVFSRGLAVTAASSITAAVALTSHSPVVCESAPSSSVPPTFFIERDQNPDIAIISGTASRALSTLVCKELNRPLSDVDISQFSDGETSISIRESMRGKDVFIIQTCAPPVNDSVMELLLSIAAAKRSGATSVTAVIPYFGYRLNRRGLPISTTHHSRFLWNAAGDLAKMLLVVGADKVISVDLQRPGQGHEACFFKTQLPAETISTNDMFVSYFQNHLDGSVPVAVVSPNTEFVKKAKKFQRKLKSSRDDLIVDYAAFLRSDSDTSFMKGASLELQGDVKGKDVILIEDYIGKCTLIEISRLLLW
jgi:ribose-phosphate pyrophosphokinase